MPAGAYAVAAQPLRFLFETSDVVPWDADARWERALRDTWLPR